MAAPGADLRARRWRRRRSSATPRPTRPTTSPAATPRPRWRSSPGSRSRTPVHLDQVATRGSSTSPPTTSPTRSELGLGAEADRHRRARRRRHQRARAPGVPLRRATRWPRSTGRSTPSRSSPTRSPRSRCRARAPAARRPRAPCSATSISAMIPPATDAGDDRAAADRRRRRVGVLPAHGGRRPARRARPGRRDPRDAGRVDQVGRAARAGRQRAARDGPAPAARVALLRGAAADRRSSTSCARRRARSA